MKPALPLLSSFLLLQFPWPVNAQSLPPIVIREAGQPSPVRQLDKCRRLDLVTRGGVDWRSLYINNAKSLQRITLDLSKGSAGTPHLCTGVRLADAAAAILAHDPAALQQCVEELAVLTEMTGIPAPHRNRLAHALKAGVGGDWEEASAQLKCLQYAVLDQYSRQHRDLGMMTAGAHYAQSLRYAAEGVILRYDALPDRAPAALLRDFQWTRWLTAGLPSIQSPMRTHAANSAFFVNLPRIHRMLEFPQADLTKDDIYFIKSLADEMINNLMERAATGSLKERALYSER